ncbi:MAG: hypothetical protein ABJG68_07225 [Crocinitomicaceae bacterium]
MKALLTLFFFTSFISLFGQTEFHKLQTQLIDGKVIHMKDNIPFTGMAYENYKDGTRRVETDYLNGEVHGLYKSWSPKGVKILEIEYQNGEKTGNQKRWNMAGKLVYHSQMKGETGILFCDCRDEIGNDACEYGSDVVWAKYENGIKSGKWKMKKGDEFYTVQHHSFGFNDWIKRYVIKDEKGQIITSTIEPLDYSFEKFNALSPNQVLYGNKQDLFYDRQSASFVNPIHQDSFPEAGYFNGFQKPISCTIMDFYPSNQVKLKAIVENGQLVELHYFHEDGSEFEGWQHHLLKEKKLAQIRESSANQGFITKEKVTSILSSSCHLIDSLNLRFINHQFDFPDHSDQVAIHYLYDWKKVRNEHAILPEKKFVIDIWMDPKSGKIISSECIIEK